MSLLAIGIPAAEEPQRYGVELFEPESIKYGKLILSGDRMDFVATDHPEASFSVDRRHVRSVREVGGRMTVETVQPFSFRGSERTKFVVQIHPEHAGNVIAWVGKQPATSVNEADRVVTHEVWIPVEHKPRGGGNIQGKLVAGDTKLRFDAASNTSHSRTWNYDEIERVEKVGDAQEVKVVTRGGEEYAFRIAGRYSDTAAFDIIRSRVAAGRGAGATDK
jgi:hypothetical protein